MSKIILFTLLITIMGLAVAVNVEAADLFGEDGIIFNNLKSALTAAGYTDEQQGRTVDEIAIDILTAALSVFGIIFFTLLLYGGWLWMTAGGNQERIDQSKKTLKWAAIGIAIVIASLVIGRFIINSILKATGAIV